MQAGGDAKAASEGGGGGGKAEATTTSLASHLSSQLVRGASLGQSREPCAEGAPACRPRGLLAAAWRVEAF